MSGIRGIIGKVVGHYLYLHKIGYQGRTTGDPICKEAKAI